MYYHVELNGSNPCQDRRILNLLLASSAPTQRELIWAVCYISEPDIVNRARYNNILIK